MDQKQQRDHEIDLLKDQITHLTARVQELEEMVHQMSFPIIPSIIPNTILIPITGELSPERFEVMIPKILEYTADNPVDSIIIDFTAISIREVTCLNILSQYVGDLNSALKLMGVQVLVVGFNPQFTQELVRSGLSFIKELNAFSTFRAALQSLAKQKGISLEKTK
ncbi:STAS domain-containing protein [Peribacillus deserti]|uniref:Histidine kinase n=1 Tax=Peribacillus deserti TaxID=673318 RepID=A0A2N5M188_9BACI|nr:STAS domain-containing protein [Peribacillus deserti]PLT28119.1 histidine kinase [Peribacillus deserti]